MERILVLRGQDCFLEDASGAEWGWGTPGCILLLWQRGGDAWLCSQLPLRTQSNPTVKHKPQRPLQSPSAGSSVVAKLRGQIPNPTNLEEARRVSRG